MNEAVTLGGMGLTFLTGLGALLYGYKSTKNTTDLSSHTNLLASYSTALADWERMVERKEAENEQLRGTVSTLTDQLEKTRESLDHTLSKLIEATDLITALNLRIDELEAQLRDTSRIIGENNEDRAE